MYGIVSISYMELIYQYLSSIRIYHTYKPVLWFAHMGMHHGSHMGMNYRFWFANNYGIPGVYKPTNITSTGAPN